MANKILKFHAGMMVFSTAMGIVFNPQYNDKYSWRRNCLDGAELGLFIGIMWPFSYPVLTYCYVRRLVDADPVETPQKKDWTKEWRKEVEQIIKDMKGGGDKPPPPLPL